MMRCLDGCGCGDDGSISGYKALLSFTDSYLGQVFQKAISIMELPT
jgi:hypothetical protein